MLALSDNEIKKKLEAFQGWELQGTKLYRKFEFKDFIQAFGFMTKLALEAEKINHHPEWHNVYNSLEIWLWTHDLMGISEKDFQLLERTANLLGEA